VVPVTGSVVDVALLLRIAVSVSEVPFTVSVLAIATLSPLSQPVESVTFSVVVTPALTLELRCVCTQAMPVEQVPAVLGAPLVSNVPPFLTVIPVSPSTVELSVSVAQGADCVQEADMGTGEPEVPMVKVPPL
jgi:hypothetical protein